MEIYLYRLHFKGPVHFGQTGIGLEESRGELSSDSLTSALINALAVLGNTDQAIASLVAEEPAFLLSSLFPFGSDEDNPLQTLYALPRPLTIPPMAGNETLARLGKDLKELRYLLPADALRWLDETPVDEGEIEGLLARGNKLACGWNAEKRRGWWTEEVRPRVALDRNSQNSSIWWCGVVYFSTGAGLYGLLGVRDALWLKVLEGAFRLLGEMGLGGERTYGMGTFQFSGFEPLQQVWKLDTSKPSKHYMLISRCYPYETERSLLSAALEAWDFEENRGYVVSGRHATTLKRKRVRMLREGSVANRSLRGQLVDVTPEHGAELGLEHRVYRSGLGFWMPLGGMI